MESAAQTDDIKEEIDDHGQDFSREIQKLLEQQNEHNALVLEKLQSIENALNEEDSRSEGSGEKGLMTLNQHHPGKDFNMIYIFKNFSKISEKESIESDTEEYYNIPWKMSIQKEEERLGFSLRCSKPKIASKYWSIDTEYEFKLRHHGASGGGGVSIRKFERKFESTSEYDGWGSKECKEWDTVKEEFVRDDSLIVECHVKIKKMDGVYEKKKSRDFNESKFSDTVLIVGDEKFYVSKLFLASHSTYFESLFLGSFSESKMAEIPLSNIDSGDFQNLLEILYGDPSAANEDTVEGILVLADMYDAKIAIERCEQFLMNESKKSTKKKIQMATRYHLEMLKNHALKSVQSVDDIKEVLFSDRSQMDPAIVAILLDKALTLIPDKLFYESE